MRKFLKNKKGFTLIELIVVIAILGILAGIAVPRFSGFQEDAKHSANAANRKAIENACKIFEVNTGAYPTKESDIEAAEYLGGTVPVPQAAKTTTKNPTAVSKGDVFVMNTTTGAVSIKASAAATGEIAISGAAK